MNTSWCSACKAALRPHKVDLKKHAESIKHTNNMSVIFKESRIDKFGEDLHKHKKNLMIYTTVLQNNSV